MQHLSFHGSMVVAVRAESGLAVEARRFLEEREEGGAGLNVLHSKSWSLKEEPCVFELTAAQFSQAQCRMPTSMSMLKVQLPKVLLMLCSMRSVITVPLLQRRHAGAVG